MEKLKFVQVHVYITYILEAKRETFCQKKSKGMQKLMLQSNKRWSELKKPHWLQRNIHTPKWEGNSNYNFPLVFKYLK